MSDKEQNDFKDELTKEELKEALESTNPNADINVVVPINFRSLFTSKDGGDLSLSKITMIVGLIVSCYVMLMGVHTGHEIPTEMFATFIASTFGANSLNKAIAVFSYKRNRNQYDYESSYSRYDDYPRRNQSEREDER